MDITLNIDASGDVKSNHYRTAFGSPLFKICYLQLAGIIGDEIDAKDNFWEGDIDYKIFNSGQPGFVHCNHHTSNVTLIVDPQASGHSCNNGPTDDPQDPTPHPDIADSNFTGDDPNCLDNLQQVLYDTYWDGYDAYLWETHTDANDRSVSDAYYYDVATVPTSTALTYPLKCQQLIQIAQSRISTPPPPINLDNDGNGQWQVAEAEGFYTKIFPNPAKGEFAIHLLQGDWAIKIVDVFGKIVYQNEVTGSVNVNASAWPHGLYFVEVVDRINKLKVGKKISIGR